MRAIFRKLSKLFGEPSQDTGQAGPDFTFPQGIPPDTIGFMEPKNPSFDKINAGSVFRISVILGDEPYMRITGKQKYLEKVRVSVEKGCLNLGLDIQVIYPDLDANLTVEIMMPVLTGVTLSGAATLQVAGVAVTALDLNLSGASTARIVGTGVKTTLEMSGAAQLHLDGLNSEKFEAQFSGASHAAISGAAAYASLETCGAAQVAAKKLQVIALTAELSGASTMEISVREKADVTATGAATFRGFGHPRHTSLSKRGAATLTMSH